MSDDNDNYAKVEYWNARYEKEPAFDWFASAYSQCLDFCIRTICETSDRLQKMEIRVLHLGTGNSQLIFDIDDATAGGPVTVTQVGLDFSEVVIENVQQKCHRQRIRWVVGDVRELLALPSLDGQTFDIIIDKGTMDALQADKENPRLDEDIEKMLVNVSGILSPNGAFIQFTWETPYFRLHLTKRQEYRWVNEQLYAKLLPESDMYYVFRYIKQ